MKIKPILWTYFKTKSKTYPIKIRVTHQLNNKTKTEYFPIDISVTKEEWDKKAGRVKLDKRVNAAEINFKIIEQSNAIEKNFLNSGKIATGKSDDFIWWFEQYYKNVQLKNGKYHQKKINTVLTRLKAYRNPLPLSQLTVSFLKEYERSMLNEGLHINYIGDTMARIRTVVKDILKEGGMEYHENPFLNYNIKFEKTEKDRLDYSDIEKLEKVSLSGKPELARDIYIFSFYCGGLRFGDICRLTKDNVQDGRLVYQMNKTKINRNIKMNTKALAIFKKYGYQFPLGIDFSNVEESISAKNADMNKHLKTACSKAKVKKISMHTARHSIADYAVKQNLGTRELKGILGHQKTATTEVYMRNFYQEENDEVMDKLFKNKSNGKK